MTNSKRNASSSPTLDTTKPVSKRIASTSEFNQLVSEQQALQIIANNNNKTCFGKIKTEKLSPVKFQPTFASNEEIVVEDEDDYEFSNLDLEKLSQIEQKTSQKSCQSNDNE